MVFTATETGAISINNRKDGTGVRMTYDWRILNKTTGAVVKSGRTSQGSVQIKGLPVGAYTLVAYGSTDFIVVPPQSAKDGFSEVSTHFGHDWNTGIWNHSSVMPMLSKLGVAAIRDEARWDRLELQKGVFTDNSTYRSYMTTAQTAGVGLNFVAGLGNPFYGARGANVDSLEAKQRFAAYVNYVLEKNPAIKHLELWNEFPYEQFNSGCRTATCYVDFLQVVYPAVKAKNPAVEIIGGGDATPTTPFMQEFMSGGGLAYVDSLAVHPYNLSTEGLREQVLQGQALQAQHAGGVVKPYRMTELGWSTRDASGTGVETSSEADQATFLSRTFVALRGLKGVKSATWYDAVNDGYSKTEAEQNFGLFTPPVAGQTAYQPKVAALAYAVQANELAGYTPTAFRQANGLDIYTFSGFGKVKYAIMASAERQPWNPNNWVWGTAILPQGTITLGEVTGKSGAQKLTTTSYLGESKTVSASGTTALAAKQEPVFITVG
jgi:hypothetical protein